MPDSGKDLREYFEEGRRVRQTPQQLAMYEKRARKWAENKRLRVERKMEGRRKRLAVLERLERSGKLIPHTAEELANLRRKLNG